MDAILAVRKVIEKYGKAERCSNLSNFNYKPQRESRQHLALYIRGIVVCLCSFGDSLRLCSQRSDLVGIKMSE